MRYTSTCVRRLTNRKGRPWVGVLKYKDDDGKYRQITKTFDPNIVKSRRAAEKAAEEWRLEMEQAAELEAERAARYAGSGRIDPDRTTVAEFCDRCIDLMDHIEASTVFDYRGSLKNFSRGSHPIADIPLSQLRNLDVREWEKGLAAGGGARGQGLTPPTITKAHRLLHECISIAISNELILRDPTIGIHPPKRQNTIPNALDEAGQARVMALLETMEPTPLKSAVALALLLGLREGEVCALRWKSVDFDTNVLTVSEAIGRAEGSTYIKEAKTPKSRRSIVMPSQLHDILLERHDAMVEECRQASETAGIEVMLTPQHFVIGEIDGRYCAPQLVQRGWATLAKTYGIKGPEGKRITFHDLRHTCATLAINEHVDVETVSGMLGHSSTQQTLDRYGRTTPERLRTAAETIGRAYDSYKENPPQAKVLELDRTGTDADVDVDEHAEGGDSNVHE